MERGLRFWTATGTPDGQGLGLSERGLRGCLLGLGALLLAYVALRARVLAFTHDESLSFLQLQSGPWAWLELGSNNHVLNSLGMVLAQTLLGSGEFALRLPNVLPGAFFFLSAGRLALLFRHRLLGLVCFLVLCTNPFVLDFFSLARGYGLGLALELCALALLLPPLVRAANAQPAPLLPGAFAACGLALLATLANFTFFFVYAALVAVCALLLWRPPAPLRKPHPVGLLAFVLCNGALLLLLYRMLDRLKRRGDFYYGGQDSFFQDTVLSLLRTWAYGLEPPLALLWGAGALACATPVLLAGLALLRGRRAQLPGLVVTALLGLCVLGSFATRHLAGSLWPVERTALFLWPLFVCGTFLLLDGLWQPTRRVASLAFRCLGLGVLLHLVLSANLETTRTWYPDAATRTMLQDLKQALPSGGQEANTLAADWILLPSLEYYQRTGRVAEALQLADRRSPDSAGGLVYLLERSLWAQPPPEGPCQVLRRYPTAGTALLDCRPARP